MITQDENGRWRSHAADRIILVPYDPRWMEPCAVEHRAIGEGVDAAMPLVIEHCGSTAIPGAPAKPIIDSLLGADHRP